MGTAWAGRAAFATGATAATLAVYLPWLGFDLRLQPRKSALNDYWKARVPDMIYGRAHRPFVQRTLVPSTIRLLRQALPRWVLGALRRTASGPPLRLPRKLGVLGWEPAFFTEYVLVMIVLFLVLLGFPFALRSLFRAVYEAPVAAGIAPFAATLVLPFFFFDRGTHYLYDFATLVLFTLALDAIARKSLGRFYVIFALGVLNKETMILATLVFALVSWERLPRSTIVKHVTAQLALFGGIRLALERVFAGNPGGPAEWHLIKNWRLALAPPDPWSLVLLAAGGILVFARLGQRPRLLRQALVVLIPLLATYVLFGIYGEIRVFYEAYPLLFLLAFQNVCEALGRPLRERVAPGAEAFDPGARSFGRNGEAMRLQDDR
jgi:hypothetical protein